MLECLTSIVGVIKDPESILLNGLTDEIKTQLTTSTSGLFLDDLPGGVHMKELKYLDAVNTFAGMALNSLANAAKQLEDDLVIALNTRYKKARKRYEGQIGRMSYATTLNVTGNWQGLRIAPIDSSDGILTVTRLNIIINQAATFYIRLYEVLSGSVMGTEIGAWQITTIANAYKMLDFPNGENVATPLKLPLRNSEGETLEYWFVYDRNEAGGTFLPKDTKIDCTTCTSNRVVNEYVDVQGVSFTDINQLNYRSSDSYSRGLILDVSLNCDNQQLFCREYDSEEAISVCMARAVWFKAGELLIEEVLKSPDVNRYTTMAREYLWGKRNHFRSEYEARINYLSATIDVTSSNCYVCNTMNTNQPYMGKILS